MQFYKIRNHLRIIANTSNHPSSLIILQNSLKELKLLREHWFPSETMNTKNPLIKTSNLKSISELSPSENANNRIIPIIRESPTFTAERYMPYRILWAKVIVRAAYDYALWKDAKDLRLKKFAEDAERWLFESSDLELSFENICFAFDFPVNHIRQRTRILTRDDVKKLEFRERQSRTDLLGEFVNGNSA